MERKTTFVTGSTGFIGKHLVTKLRNEGYTVIAFKSDLRDLEMIKKAINVARPSVVYHLGAIVDLSRNYETAMQCIEINIKGTLNLLESLRGVAVDRFIYTSTEEVYGSNTLPYKEEQLPNPPSPYAISKVAAEQLIRLYAQEFGFPARIFRIGTTYGPDQPLTRFIPQIILKALHNEAIPLNSGTKKRDYIFIDDVIDALVLALSKPMHDRVELFNLGGGKQYSLKEMVALILRLSKSNSKPQFGMFPDRIFEADEWLLDITAARKMLHWQPKTPLKEGLKKMIAFYQ